MYDAVLIALGAIVVMGFGALFVLHGRRMRRKFEHLRQVGQRTSAVVVSYEYKRDADGESTRYPVVQFQTADGHLVTAHTDFGGDLVPNIGDHVEVLFDPARPEEAHIESELSDRMNRLVGVIGWVIIVGAAITAVTLLIFLGGDGAM